MNIRWTQAIIFFLLGVVLANRIAFLSAISGKAG